MPKTLTDADLAELAQIIETLDYRLVTSDGQSLAEAGPGDVLTPENSFTLDLRRELDLIRRARAILGHGSGPAAGDAEEQAQKAAVKRGIDQG